MRTIWIFMVFFLSSVRTLNVALAEEKHACSQGDPMTFQLEAVTPLPSLENWPLPQHGGEIVESPTDTRNIRLDVCFNEKTNPPHVTLSRVTFQFQSFTTATTIELAPTDRVQGLASALFGDHAELEAIVSLGGGNVLVVKGWRDGKGNTFATALPAGLNADGSLVTHSLSLVTGKLVLGDPFANRPCPDAQWYRQESFFLGTARFDANFCAFIGGGQTEGYDLLSIEVTDTNPALSPAEQAPVKLDKASFAGRLTYKWNHHNACDSFYLKLPHAEYSATTAAVAGCGLPVPNAPERVFSDSRQSVLYRVKYPSIPVTTECELGCWHYLYGECF